MIIPSNATPDDMINYYAPSDFKYSDFGIKLISLIEEMVKDLEKCGDMEEKIEEVVDSYNGLSSSYADLVVMVCEELSKNKVDTVKIEELLDKSDFDIEYFDSKVKENL
jgi:hypothetical protein